MTTNLQREEIIREIYQKLYKAAEEMDKQHSHTLVITHAIPKGCIDPKYTAWLRKLIAISEDK